MDGWCAEPVFLITDRSVPPESIIKIRQKGLHGDPKHYGSLWIINPRDGGLATFYREYLTDIVDPALESQRTQYHPDLEPGALQLLAFDGEMSQLNAVYERLKAFRSARKAMMDDAFPLLKRTCARDEQHAFF